MIRLSEIKLPLAALPAGAYDADTHPDALLRAQAAQVLGVPESAIAALHVHKRSFDARKADLMAVYILDLQLANASQAGALLARHTGHPHIQPTPDMAWRPVGCAGEAPAQR